MNLQCYHPIKLFRHCNFNSRHIAASIGKSNHSSEHYRYTSDKHTYARPDWSKAVSDAEKIVGYPTSFLSLRWLLSDEIANVALHLRKLVGSNHPLLKTAKHLLYNNSNNMQAYGLIVLLISKTVGYNTNIDVLNQDTSAGVLHSQRALAEVTEMIRTSHLIHKGLINIYPGLYKENDTLNDMTFGNKIALLSGDYLLSNSCAELAALKNQYLVELMSSAVRDLAEAEFIGRQDSQNNPLPPKYLGHYLDGPNQIKPNSSNQPNITEDGVDHHRNNLNKNSDKNWNYLYNDKQESNVNKNEIKKLIDEIVISKNLNLSKIKIKNNDAIEYLFSRSKSIEDWTYRNILLGANLLGKACQGTILLADQNKVIQKQGYDFGLHLALSWQAFVELEQYHTLSVSSSMESSANEYFNLTSAPILFHLEYSKASLRQAAYEEIEKGVDNVQNIAHNKIIQLIAQGLGVQLTKLLQNYHSIKALNILDKFKKSEARNALVNIVKVMGNI